MDLWITLDEGLVREINAVAGRGKRSAYIAQAVREALQQQQREGPRQEGSAGKSDPSGTVANPDR